jgi:hypothetical protein
MGWFERVEQEIMPFDPNLAPIDYLLARMRDPRTEDRTKDRIAIALLPFTSPKLAVAASIPFDERFANLLDRAKKRSDKVKVIEVQPEPKPEPEPPPLTPYKPHATIDVRRFRRRF